MTTRVLLGVDVGTTDLKVLATTGTGTEIAVVAAPNRWSQRAGRFTELDPDVLVQALVALLGRAVAAASGRIGPVQVAAIGLTGMGETGVLLDAGRPVHPLIAWFDPRGGTELRTLARTTLSEFCGRTGLPLSAQSSLAKLLWLRDSGTGSAGRRWLNLLEYLVVRLGGAEVTELSLLGRTGLWDQDAGTPWAAALAELGTDENLLPPRVPAGTPLGRVAPGGELPAELAGAVLTLAGHDHPVAAVGCGVTGADEVFDSFGTAEALVRTVPGLLPAAARERLAGHGIDAVPHVLPGRQVLLGGTKAGLVLRRTLRMLGADDRGDRRRELDEAAEAHRPDFDGAGITVAGAENREQSLRIEITSDEITPAAWWLATLEHTSAEARACLDRMAAEIGPATSAVVAGGWTRMASVRAAKLTNLPGVRFSDRTQAGAFGAALFAASALDQAERRAARGDHSGVAIDDPPGISPEFAARFAAHSDLETPKALSPQTSRPPTSTGSTTVPSRQETSA